jgi:AcrR family transcriptional regulator
MLPVNQHKIGRATTKRAAAPSPTKDKLFHAALELLDSHYPEAITGEMLLEHSGASRGSLYHHYADLSDLLELALVHKFAGLVDANIDALTQMVNESASADEMFDWQCRISTVTQSPDRRGNRFFRARMIGFAEGNPRLTERLGIEQKRMTDTLASLFTTAQERGWMNKMFDPQAAALFVQAYTLGRVIDDISVDQVDPDNWNDLINRVIKQVFF